MLNSDNKMVTYLNKKGERTTMPLNFAMESDNREMTKRLKYTKDLLKKKTNNHNHTQDIKG